MVKVSIIIPIYNSGKYLEKCLNSCIKQTLRNIEIICVNNGSTDNSLEILNQYKDKVIIIDLATPSIGNARNEGIKIAQGKYLYFLDSDDFLEFDALKKLYDKAQKKDLDMVMSDFTSIVENASKESYVETYKFDILEQCDIVKQLHQFNLGPAKLIKRELVVKNNIKFPLNLKYEDVPFILSCLKYSKKVGKINESLFYYLIHNNSETTVRDIKVFDILKIVKLCEGIYEKDLLENFVVKILTNYTIQQRYQKNRKIRCQFFNEVFEYLNQNYPNWQKSSYFKERNVLKRIIEKSKIMTIFYCDVYNILY